MVKEVSDIVAHAEARQRLTHSVIGASESYDAIFAFLRDINLMPNASFRRVEDIYIYEDVIFSEKDGEIFPFEGTWRLIDRPSRGGDSFLEKAKTKYGTDEIESIQSGFFLGSAGSANYGHWLIDDLPRLCLSKAYLQDEPIIISAHGDAIDKVRLESLEVVCPGCTTKLIDRQRFYKIRFASFCDPISMHPVLKSSAALSCLRACVMRHVESGRRRVFIDRSDRRYRSISNRDDLLAFCARNNLEIVYSETLDFKQQVDLFMRAEIVVGIMGAAMTNAVFCSDETVVLFLAPETWKEPFYFDLFDTLSYLCTTYYGKVSEPAGRDSHLHNFHVDFTVVDKEIELRGARAESKFSLIESDHIIGDCLVEAAQPKISIFERAIYLPLVGAPDNNREWGLYDSSLCLIEDAAYKRGPVRNLVGQSDCLCSSIPPLLKIDSPVIYGGMTHDHFGHFLLSVLPRFWSGVQASFPNAKILMHSTTPIAAWLAKPFVRDVLAAANIKAEDIFTLSEPCVLSCVIVPGPALVEQSRVHKVLDGFGARLGERLSARNLKASDQPLYISKERTVSGIWRCGNEKALAAALEKRNCRIFYPEEHHLGEQIATLQEHRFIISLQSSALHSTLFCSEPRRIVALGSTTEMVSNYQLIDAVKESTSKYVVPAGGMLDGTPSPNFQISRIISDPEACASAMLELF